MNKQMKSVYTKALKYGREITYTEYICEMSGHTMRQIHTKPFTIVATGEGFTVEGEKLELPAETLMSFKVKAK